MENDVQHWAALEVKELEAELRHQANRYAILEETIATLRRRDRDTRNDIRMLDLAVQKLINGRIP